ncbi:MAG: calcium/sodium antiporter [Pseudomonadales bacterium]|nr:calcium/sodium antiporter [Pseudomonadales bacterium]MDP7594765.1 calcium/sodium antiporter [Pseudomonadales bacterium]HJN50056.1 calcium/sodium antiporter [Pseudomonadales bacterium]
MLLLCLALLIGFIVLFWGADFFVDGAVATARNLNISPMFIGLTVVSLGTSAPEIFVAAMSAFQGAPQLAVGNAIGSNIANIGMVLGITALLVPLPFRIDVLSRDLPVLIFVTLCAGAALLNLYLGPLDGLLLMAGLVIFIIRLIAEHRRSSSMEVAAGITELEDMPVMTTKKSLLVLLMGLLLLLGSSEILVYTAVEIARTMDISELIIGLTVIAVGTSLPELVVSVTSALKGQTDLAIGNIVGSNIFNILAVLSLPCLIAPTTFEAEIFWRDYLLMLMMTALLVLFAYGVHSKARITRLEGGFLLMVWITYLFSLYSSAQGPG